MSAYAVITSFFEKCLENGVELLADDVKYICLKLNKIPGYRHKAVLERYLDEWCIGMAEEGKTQYKQNTGRRRANLYLLDVDTQLH